MRVKLVVLGLAAASLLGAPVIAFAQNETGQPGPKAMTAHHKMAAHHKMKSSHHMRTGTTTGMSTTGSSPGQGKSRPGGQSVSGKPPGS